ncbi:unnamed protein product [Linum trigynum]|uniref:Uncharacterized protein n=1 Tax=Linum trigynum TaxID=586398 RepID=A0AAV2CJR5_9ROSI
MGKYGFKLAREAQRREIERSITEGFLSTASIVSRRSFVGDSDQITRGAVPFVWEIQTRKSRIPPKSSHNLRNLPCVYGRKMSFLAIWIRDFGSHGGKLKMFPGRIRRNV